MAKLIKVHCKNCNKVFYRPTGRFNEAVKFGWNQYCSRRCEYKYKTKRKILVCENCGKFFERAPNNISFHNYCSKSCAAVINNKNRPERGALIIQCANCGKKFKKWITGNKKYCSQKCMREARRKTPENLIKAIRDAAKKLKRVPARRELRSISDSCRKVFGSWNNAVLAAGLTPNRSHDNQMYKRTNAKALDGHLCDSISELLIDNWLHKNHITHKREADYPGTHHKADWEIISKNKKIFIEYFGLANDSPRYDRSIKLKKELCLKNKIKLIEIYHWDLYPKRHFERKIKDELKDLSNVF